MLWSCGNTNQSSTFPNNTIDSTNTENSKIEVDYTQLAVIQTNDEIFQFKAPKDLFVEKANEKNVFLSEKLQATIHFVLTETE